MKPTGAKPARVTIRRRADLPQTRLDWLALTDHFVATVGPAAGRGAPLGDLLVLADATLAPARGFQLHGHQSMEVVTLVLEGEIAHREPGRELPVPAGSAQWMSAGTGIVHAETNPGSVPARLLQIWLRPREPGGAPEHVIAALPELRPWLQRLSPPVSRTDATLSMAQLAPSESTPIDVAAERAAYLVVVGGACTIDGQLLADGDGALLPSGTTIVRAQEPARLVVIDVARPNESNPHHH